MKKNEMLSSETLINSRWNRNTACLVFVNMYSTMFKKKLSVYLICFFISKALVNGCEKGWVPFARNCYKFSSSKATFKDAMVRK